MNIEETIRRRWDKFEPMRIRMMQEAYDCADRNEVEAYNSIKVMCGEVLRMAEELVLAEREACAKVCDQFIDEMQKVLPVEKLRETDPYKAFYKANAARIIQDTIRARGQA
jgi:hypothetical protein